MHELKSDELLKSLEFYASIFWQCNENVEAMAAVSCEVEEIGVDVVGITLIDEISDKDSWNRNKF